MTAQRDPVASEVARSSDAFKLHLRLGDFEFGAEGPHNLVMEAYERVLEDVDESRLPGIGTIATQGEAALTERPSDDELVPLPVFLKRRKLDTNVLKAAAILVWAERYEGKESLSPSEVLSYWKRTPYRVPGNLPRDLGRAVAEGWARQEGHGAYSSTGYGGQEIDSREEDSQEKV